MVLVGDNDVFEGKWISLMIEEAVVEWGSVDVIVGGEICSSLSLLLVVVLFVLISSESLVFDGVWVVVVVDRVDDGSVAMTLAVDMFGEENEFTLV